MTIKKLNISEVADIYGALNDIAVPAGSPVANRRSLTTTNAISEVIASHFTPDVLRNKDEFLGVVLASIPTAIPMLSSKSQQFSTWNSSFTTAGGKNMPIFYRYKVLIPELECRCLNLKSPNPNKAPDKGLSTAQSVNTMQDVGLDVDLYNASEGIRAIQPGTLVAVGYEDLARLRGPKITQVFKKVFDFEITGDALPLSSKFDAAAASGGNQKRTVGSSPANPGKYQWSDPERKRQKKATYIATGALVRNGELEKTNLLAEANSGALLLKDAVDDWNALTLAYEKKFPGKTIVGSGYRSYERQVYFYECYKNKNCNSGNLAAVPGRSNHGWGAAVDINRAASGWTNGRRSNSPEFRWLNKWGPDKFNFSFTVSKANGSSQDEHWHMDWTRYNKAVRGVNVKTARGFPLLVADNLITLEGENSIATSTTTPPVTG